MWRKKKLKPISVPVYSQPKGGEQVGTIEASQNEDLTVNFWGDTYKHEDLGPLEEFLGYIFFEIDCEKDVSIPTFAGETMQFHGERNSPEFAFFLSKVTAREDEVKGGYIRERQEETIPSWILRAYKPFQWYPGKNEKNAKKGK